jgi:hypothetical protein
METVEELKEGIDITCPVKHYTKDQSTNFLTVFSLTSREKWGGGKIATLPRFSTLLPPWGRISSFETFSADPNHGFEIDPFRAYFALSPE